MVERSHRAKASRAGDPSETAPGDDGLDDDDEDATGASQVPQETASLLEPVRQAARETLDEDDAGDEGEEEDDGERTGPSSTADLDGDGAEAGGTVDVDDEESIQTAPSVRPLSGKRPRPARRPTREKPPPPVPSQELPQVRGWDLKPKEAAARRPGRASPLGGDGFEADARDVPVRKAKGLSAVSQKVLRAIEDSSPLNLAASVAAVLLFLVVGWFLLELLAR